jgi:hypothetical protein
MTEKLVKIIADFKENHFDKINLNPEELHEEDLFLNGNFEKSSINIQNVENLFTGRNLELDDMLSSREYSNWGRAKQRGINRKLGRIKRQAGRLYKEVTPEEPEEENRSFYQCQSNEM